MNLREILIEFGKGCTCGAPGECEDCLNGAIRAIEAIMPEKIVLESRQRTGNLEVINRIYE